MLTGEFKAALIRNQSTTCSWINGWTTLHYLACPYTMLWGIVWWQVCCNCNDTSEDLDKCGTNPHGMRHGCVTRSNVLHTMYVMFAYLWLCLCIVVFIQQDGIQCSFARRSSCCKIATAEVLHSNLLDLYGTVGGGTFAVWQKKVSEHLIHKTSNNCQWFVHQVKSIVLPSVISAPQAYLSLASLQGIPSWWSPACTIRRHGHGCINAEDLQILRRHSKFIDLYSPSVV